MHFGMYKNATTESEIKAITDDYVRIGFLTTEKDVETLIKATEEIQ